VYVIGRLKASNNREKVTPLIIEENHFY